MLCLDIISFLQNEDSDRASSNNEHEVDNDAVGVDVVPRHIIVQRIVDLLIPLHRDEYTVDVCVGFGQNQPVIQHFAESRSSNSYISTRKRLT